MLTIHDEELARRLREIAARERRAVEDVLRALLADYAPAHNAAPESADEPLKRIRQAAYDRARRYWAAAGDTEKAALTDDDLDARFGAFDADGIPRLKSELATDEPPVGTLAYAARIAREMGGIPGDQPIDPANADEILDTEFADYLLRRMTGDDASR